MSFFKKRTEFLLIYCFQLIISILNHFYLNRPFQFVSCCKIYLQFHHSDIARTIIFCQEGKSESFEWSLFDTWNMIKVQKIILPVFMRCTCCPQRRCSWHFPSCVACVKTVRSASSSWHLWCGCGMEFHFAALKERCLGLFSWAIGQINSFDISLFQTGKSKTNLLSKLVPSHCLLRAPHNAGCEATLCHKVAYNLAVFRGMMVQAWNMWASANHLYLEREKTSPIWSRINA